MSSTNNVSKFTPKSQGHSGNTVLKVIGLAIVALALVGLIFSSFYSGGGAGGNQLIFGQYGSKKIVYQYDNEFGRAVETGMAQYNANFNQNGNSAPQMNEFIRMMAWRQAFNTSTVNAAIDYNLEASGYLTSSRAIDRAIIEFGPYQTDGQFDERKYRAASATQKASLRENYGTQLGRSIWQNDVLQTQYHSTASQNFLADARNAQRSFEYITIPFSSFPEEQVKAYGEENSKLFVRHQVSRATLENEEDALAFITDYEAKRQDIEAFSTLATERSNDGYKDQGGSMGRVEYFRLTDILSNEDADAVAALPVGNVAGPFETDYGWMVFRTDAQAEAFVMEDRLADVRSYMNSNEVGLIEDTLIAQADQLLASQGTSDFRTTMELAGYEVKETAPFPINYGGDSLLGPGPETGGATELAGTNSSDEFWNAIIPLTSIGDVSRPLVLNSAVALFALSSENTLETPDYWEEMLTYELARSRQADFTALVIDEENPLFKNNFTDTYAKTLPRTEG
ncbi:MAG: peptidylprolyl isomerase [Spirochaetales bacterium]|nr:peptidylprolyl isomerase [Spirochaetales bacterium]